MNDKDDMIDVSDMSDMSEVDLKIAIKEIDIKILEIERALLKSNIEVSHVNEDKDKTSYKKEVVMLVALYLLLVIIYFFMRDTYLMSLMGMPTLSDKTAACLFFLMC